MMEVLTTKRRRRGEEGGDQGLDDMEARCVLNVWGEPGAAGGAYAERADGLLAG